MQIGLRGEGGVLVFVYNLKQNINRRTFKQHTFITKRKPTRQRIINATEINKQS